MDDIGWSDEQVFSTWLAQVTALFAEDNTKWRANEEDFITAHRADGHPNYDPEVRDSFLWEVFTNCVISYKYNGVKVILPRGFGINSEIIAMFGESSVTWGGPYVCADNGDVVLNIMLVDHWSDKCEADWQSK